MLKIIEAIQGKNPCFLKDRRITGLVAPLAHDIGCFATHAGRFVECPEFLEEKGKYENKSKNWWNKITVRKMVHGFIGLDADEKWVVAITLPFDIACWGCAGGKYGSYNYPPTKSAPKQFAHIQIETCQDNKKSREFYENAMNTLAEFYAWTIQQGICSDDLSLITCHREAHQLGFAGNHSDIWDWAAKFGETQKSYMPSFRDRVKKYLDAGEVQVEWYYGSHMNTCKKSTKYSPTVRYLQTCLNRLGYVCEVDGLLWNETLGKLNEFKKKWFLPDDGICDSVTWSSIMSAMNGKFPVKPEPEKTYTGEIKTSKGNGVSLWKNVGLSSRVCKVPEGATVEVTGDCIKGTSAPAKYTGYNGYIDTKYLINIKNI
jgi:hypothetical protein